MKKVKGKVKFYNQRRSFGFIAGEDGTDVFVHVSDIPEGITLEENDEVEFEVTETDRGKKAINVKKL